jgi:hypothetical protein
MMLLSSTDALSFAKRQKKQRHNLNSACFIRINRPRALVPLKIGQSNLFTGRHRTP